jgi:hypothetical protein
MAAVPHRDIPVLTGFLWLFRSLGQLMGVALTSSILCVLLHTRGSAHFGRRQSVLASQLARRITGPGAKEVCCPSLSLLRAVASTDHLQDQREFCIDQRPSTVPPSLGARVLSSLTEMGLPLLHLHGVSVLGLCCGSMALLCSLRFTHLSVIRFLKCL